MDSSKPYFCLILWLVGISFLLTVELFDSKFLNSSLVLKSEILYDCNENTWGNKNIIKLMGLLGSFNFANLYFYKKPFKRWNDTFL